jgi:uncharacterized damage-inducible protein DinB
MARVILDRYLRWFEYEKDAHQKVIRSLESVPAERRTSAEYQKAVDLFGHMIAARRLWLGRMGVLPPFTGEPFPKGAQLSQLAEQAREVEQAWDEHFRRLTDEEAQRPFEYMSLDKKPFRNHIEDVLTQLFGHSWYHRGQIAMLVRQAGGEPAVTDFVYWCREPLS